MHLYGEQSVPPDTSQLVTSYVVPPRGGIECTGLIFWAEITSEFFIYKNGTYIGGGRNSAANPTVQLDYSSCPLGLSANDVLIVMGTHIGNIPKLLKATLLMNLL